MRQNIFRKAGVAGLVCAAISLLAGAPCRADDEDTQKVITKSFAAEPGGSVSVITDQGDIELVTGSQDAAEVRVERTVAGATDSQAASILKKNKVTASLEGKTLYVEVRSTKVSPAKLAELSVHIRVTVPRRFEAQLETEGGTIEATGLQGGVEAKTSAGDMAFAHIHGPVSGQSAGGNIRVTGGTGKLQVHTSGGTISIKDYTGPGAQADSLGGDIEVTGCTGPLTAKTSGGNITVENFTGPQAGADSGGGTIALDLASALLADSFFRTTGGNITVKMTDNVAVNLLAMTDGGTITTAVPVSATTKGRIQEGKLEGTINGGGPKLMLKTGGGNIEILKK